MSGAEAFHMDAVVAEDGSIVVPASEVARLGLRPGTHLHLVTTPRKVSAGVLEGLLDDDALDRLDAALDDNKRERIAAVEET